MKIRKVFVLCSILSLLGLTFCNDSNILLSASLSEHQYDCYLILYKDYSFALSETHYLGILPKPHERKYKVFFKIESDSIYFDYDTLSTYLNFENKGFFQKEKLTIGNKHFKNTGKGIRYFELEIIR